MGGIFEVLGHLRGIFYQFTRYGTRLLESRNRGCVHFSFSSRLEALVWASGKSLGRVWETFGRRRGRPEASREKKNEKRKKWILSYVLQYILALGKVKMRSKMCKTRSGHPEKWKYEDLKI